jgi:hypothetical protein
MHFLPGFSFVLTSILEYAERANRYLTLIHQQLNSMGERKVSKSEDKLKVKIDEMLRQKAESCETAELPDSDHGYVDALIWLKEGSIQLTPEGLGKEIEVRKYADPDQSKAYYDGYESALKILLKIRADMKE